MRLYAGITLPLGGLRLSEASGNSLSKARALARQEVKSAKFLQGGAGRTFYAVGGTWRNIAKLHMEITNYPLHMMQGYQLQLNEMQNFLEQVVLSKDSKDPAWQSVSKSRPRASALRRCCHAGSAGRYEAGARYLLGAGRARGLPLFAAAAGRAGERSAPAGRDQLAILRARSPEHARELADWTGQMIPAFGITETEEETRYRRAACLLADISWRAHPDYRGLQALNLIAHSSLVGITHPGRAYLALANYYRFEGLHDDGATGPLSQIATPRLLGLAKLLGGLLRVVYLFSASMPGVVDHLYFRKVERADLDLEFVVPHDYADFAGERLEGRLQQLGKLTNKRIAFVFE